MWRWRLLPAERPYGRNRTYALTSKRPTRVSLMYSMGIFAHPAGLDVRRKWYNFGKKKKVSLDFRGNLSWRQETKTLVWDKSAAGIRDFPFAPEDWTVHRFESGQRDSGPRRMSYHFLRSDLAPWKKRGGGGEGGRDGSRGRQGSGGEGVLTKPLQRSCYELVVNLCILQGGGLGPGNCVATERVALIQP